MEEHQDALELIMSKYRKQMLQLMVAKKAVDAEPVLKAHQSHSAVRNFCEKILRELHLNLEIVLDCVFTFEEN